MPIEKQQDMWECDICGLREYESGTKDPKWAKLNIEINSIEQEFITKVICWHCVQTVKEQAK